MMKLLSKGVVLTRTDFQEADRIVTFLTPDYGKVRLIAKGVRKVKSKLAGGIELFSVSNISFMPSKTGIGTLISTRLELHYHNIAHDIDRTMLGYNFLKRINKITEDAAGEEYFTILVKSLEGLNNTKLSLKLLDLWFMAQLLNANGHIPNLQTDADDNPLDQNKIYDFDHEKMAFRQNKSGIFTANHIKMISLAIRSGQPEILTKVQGNEALVDNVLPLTSAMLNLTS